MVACSAVQVAAGAIGFRERRLKCTSKQLWPYTVVLLFFLQVSKPHVSPDGLSMREKGLYGLKGKINNAKSISILAALSREHEVARPQSGVQLVILIVFVRTMMSSLVKLIATEAVKFSPRCP